MATRKSKRAKTVTEQLRQAIDDSGESRYAICKALDIDQGHLCRFVAGQSGLGLDVLNRLCAYLGLELRRKGG